MHAAKKMTQLGVEAWLTGRRRSQGGARESLALLEIDDMDGRLKMNPLINWPLENVWAHIRTHNLPYNALHDQVAPRLFYLRRFSHAISAGKAFRLFLVGEVHVCGMHVCGLHSRPGWFKAHGSICLN